MSTKNEKAGRATTVPFDALCAHCHTPLGPDDGDEVLCSRCWIDTYADQW